MVYIGNNDWRDYLAHYGTPRHSGRYPWGSGKNPRQGTALYYGGKSGGGKKVFISGSSKTQTSDSPYYRKELPEGVRKSLDKHVANGDEFLVGDAPGVDRQVQDYLKGKGYKNVTVYATGQARYIADDSWKVNLVDGGDYEPGSKAYLRQKDIAMTSDADEGLAVVLDNGGAGATRNNVKRLILQAKDVEMYKINTDGVDEYVKNVLHELDSRLETDEQIEKRAYDSDAQSMSDADIERQNFTRYRSYKADEIFSKELKDIQLNSFSEKQIEAQKKSSKDLVKKFADDSPRQTALEQDQRILDAYEKLASARRRKDEANAIGHEYMTLPEHEQDKYIRKASDTAWEMYGDKNNPKEREDYYYWYKYEDGDQGPFSSFRFYCRDKGVNYYDLEEAVVKTDKAYSAEAKRVTTELLGKYGDTPIKNHSTMEYSTHEDGSITSKKRQKTLEDVVNEVLDDLDFYDRLRRLYYLPD